MNKKVKKTQKKKKDTIVFGLHLMIDAYDCDPKILDDPKRLYDMLDELVVLLEMKDLTRPYIIRAENNEIKDPGGWSGFIIIAESHISFHSFVKRKFMTIDIYSCKDFEASKAHKYLEKELGTTDMDVYIQRRGREYPSKDLL